MNFIDTYFSMEKRFSIGYEEQSGKYYISIPVSNSLSSYEEYYEISKIEHDRMDIKELSLIAEKCRRRENDHKIILKPGTERGVPS